MRKNILVILSMIFVIPVVFCACSVTKDLTVQSYLEDRARVDQGLSEGNSGYLVGAPSVDELSVPRKKTRKMFVVEVSKPANEIDEKVYEYEGKGMSKPQEIRKRVRQIPDVSDPPVIDIDFGDDLNIDEDEFEPGPAAEDQSGFVEYVVQKEDTLQKISKKFYDSYSKWHVIFEANRDRIKNPDALKTGITIRIPNL